MRKVSSTFRHSCTMQSHLVKFLRNCKLIHGIFQSHPAEPLWQRQRKVLGYFSNFEAYRLKLINLTNEYHLNTACQHRAISERGYWVQCSKNFLYYQWISFSENRSALSANQILKSTTMLRNKDTLVGWYQQSGIKILWTTGGVTMMVGMCRAAPQISIQGSIIPSACF